jgi:putative two-component system response regulator
MSDGEEAPTIMVVDDTPANLRLLAGMLSQRGYNVRPLPNGRLALQSAVKDPPDLVLLDVHMPGLDGYTVCQRLKANPALAKIPVIFLSALNETADKVRAFEVGGVDYVTKPFHFEEIATRVRTHIALKNALGELEQRNRELGEKVAEQVREISEAQLATIVALAKLAESRDDDTGHHVERVREYSRLIAEAMAAQCSDANPVDAAFIEHITQSSPLHDIGKVGIPDRILLKPGPLTAAEFEVIKSHTVVGAKTLDAVNRSYPRNAFVLMGRDIARHHHERWDGSGYPDGLRGREIPLSARIVAVADVYDALTSRRPYKEAVSLADAEEEIRNCSGSHFDPEIVAAFENVKQAFGELRRDLSG